MFSSRYFQLSVLHWSAHGCWASSSHCLQGVEEHGAASRGEANLQGMLLSPWSSPAEHRQTDTPWASPYCLSSNPHWVFLFFLIKFTYSLCFLRHVSWSHSLPIPSHPPSTSAPLPTLEQNKIQEKKKEKKIRKKVLKRGTNSKSCHEKLQCKETSHHKALGPHVSTCNCFLQSLVPLHVWCCAPARTLPGPSAGALCCRDPAVLGLRVRSLHVCQEIIDRVDIGPWAAIGCSAS